MVVDNWEIGAKVLFLSPDQSGIYSTIQEYAPNKIVRFKHIGSVLNNEEQAIDKETEKWSGATEIYTVTEGQNGCKLTLELDVQDEHLAFMTTTTPKALEKIKAITLDC